MSMNNKRVTKFWGISIGLFLLLLVGYSAFIPMFAESALPFSIKVLVGIFTVLVVGGGPGLFIGMKYNELLNSGWFDNTEKEG